MSAALWHRAGAFVVTAENLDPGNPARAGFDWIALFGADGSTVTPGLAAHADRVRRAGMDVVVWTVLRERPADEAALAARLCREAGAVGYIANAEAEHKGDSGGDRRRSEAFVSAFRPEAPDLSAALSTFGAAFAPFVLGDVVDALRGPMDFGPWARAGFALLPQAYFNEEEVYAVRSCVEHAARAGWPAERVHLTLGTYEGRRGRIAAADYVRALREAGAAKGFSVYTAEQTSLDDWPVYGRAVADGLALARGEQLPEPSTPPSPPPTPGPAPTPAPTADATRRRMTQLAERQIAAWRAGGVAPEKIRTFRIWKALEQLDAEAAEQTLAES